MTLVEICSYCRKRFLQCECENFHPNIIVDEEIEFQPAQEYEEVEDIGEDVEDDSEFEKEELPLPVIRLVYPPLNGIITGIGTDGLGLGVFELSKDECKILYKFLEKEYVPYTNIELHEILNRLYKFVEEEE